MAAKLPSAAGKKYIEQQKEHLTSRRKTLEDTRADLVRSLESIDSALAELTEQESLFVEQLQPMLEEFKRVHGGGKK